MKYLITLLLASNLYAMTWSDFFYGIRMQESGDGKNMVGDHGKSLGPYQIQRAYWNDALTKGKKKRNDPAWSYNRNVYNREKCEQIMKWYFQLKCPRDFANQNFERMARIHNGGPRGYRLKSTARYWRSVQHWIQSRR